MVSKQAKTTPASGQPTGKMVPQKRNDPTEYTPMAPPPRPITKQEPPPPPVVETTPAATTPPPPPPPPPAVDPYSYPDVDFNYTPQTLADPERQLGKSFGFQRYQAGQLADAATQSGMQTAMSDIAATSGLSMQDRKALQQQAARQKVTGGQSAQSPFNSMQAQNLYETDQFNVENKQKVAAANQQIMNQYEEDKAAFERQKAQFIYEQKIKEASLERALEKAREVAY